MSKKFPELNKQQDEKTDTHHQSVVVAEHVRLLAQRSLGVKVCDDEDRGRQSHHGGDQHAAPQRAVEHLLPHQQGQLEQQGISPGSRERDEQVEMCSDRTIHPPMHLVLGVVCWLWLVMPSELILIKIPSVVSV